MLSRNCNEMYIFYISYNSLLGRQIVSQLLGIGVEVGAIEHINEFFNIGCVVSLGGLLG